MTSDAAAPLLRFSRRFLKLSADQVKALAGFKL
jgi:hypothetical protein